MLINQKGSKLKGFESKITAASSEGLDFLFPSQEWKKASKGVSSEWLRGFDCDCLARVGSKVDVRILPEKKLEAACESPWPQHKTCPGNSLQIFTEPELVSVFPR